MDNLNVNLHQGAPGGDLARKRRGLKRGGGVRDDSQSGGIIDASQSGTVIAASPKKGQNFAQVEQREEPIWQLVGQGEDDRKRESWSEDNMEKSEENAAWSFWCVRE